MFRIATVIIVLTLLAAGYLAASIMIGIKTLLGALA